MLTQLLKRVCWQVLHLSTHIDTYQQTWELHGLGYYDSYTVYFSVDSVLTVLTVC